MGMYQLSGNSYMREEVFMKPQRREKAYCLWPAQLVTMSLHKYVICLKASNFKLFILVPTSILQIERRIRISKKKISFVLLIGLVGNEG